MSLSDGWAGLHAHGSRMPHIQYTVSFDDNRNKNLYLSEAASLLSNNFLVPWDVRVTQAWIPFNSQGCTKHVIQYGLVTEFGEVRRRHNICSSMYVSIMSFIDFKKHHDVLFFNPLP